MVEVPPATPVAMPVEDPMVAIAVLVLLHVPPALLLSTVGSPTQTDAVPPIAAGIAFTLTVLVAKQPVGSV